MADETSASAAETQPAPTGRPAAASSPRRGLVRGRVPKVASNAPLYRVTGRPHFINGRIVKPGETVRYEGVPGASLEPMDAAAKKAAAEAAKARAERKSAADRARVARDKLLGLVGE